MDADSIILINLKIKSMKKISILTTLLCLAAITAVAQAPMSPRAAMANCKMPADVEKNKQLDIAVGKWMEQQQAFEVKEIDFKEMEKQEQEAQRERQENVQIDPEKQMANIQRMMQDMKTHYKLTDKEFANLQRMSDKQSEAFITKRCKELGIQPLDPSKYGMHYDPKEQAETTKRQDAEAQIPALEAKIAAYDERFQQVMKRIEGLRKEQQETYDNNAKGLYDKMVEYWNKWQHIEKDVHGKNQARLAEDTYAPGGRAGDQQWQLHYVGAARESLQSLLSYAEEADDARLTIAKLRLSTIKDPMARMGIKQQAQGSAAMMVWAHFKRVTEERPNSKCFGEFMEKARKAVGAE